MNTIFLSKGRLLTFGNGVKFFTVVYVKLRVLRFLRQSLCVFNLAKYIHVVGLCLPLLISSASCVLLATVQIANVKQRLKFQITVSDTEIKNKTVRESVVEPV